MRAYFDYNATTPMAKAALEAMVRVSQDGLWNPSSAHEEGRRSKHILEDSRERVARVFGVDAPRIIFTSGATEANNHVLGALWNASKSHQKTIVTTRIEHDSVWNPLRYLESQGAGLCFLNAGRDGKLPLDGIDSLLNDEVAFVSVMTANNETGAVMPVREIFLKARERGVPVHTDAVCAVGKMEIFIPDYLTFSAHKFYGPKGVGGIILGNGVKLVPQILGGPQERGLRAGTENLAGIAGMVVALEWASQGMAEERSRLHGLRRKIQRGLARLHGGILFHENPGYQLEGTLNAAFPGHDGQNLLARLDMGGIAASYGSACHSGSLEVSRVLLGMGIPEDKAKSSIRLSFGRMTTEEEVDFLLEAFSKIL